MPHPKLNGTIPPLGGAAPQLRFVLQDRSNSDLASLRGQVVILLSVPSLDTSTCALEMRTFNQLAAGFGAQVLLVSVDTPYAMKRFCVAEGIENVRTGSDFRFHDLARNWGVEIAEGGLQAATARAVWVLDREGVIRYHELSAELGHEPNYEAALEAARGLL
ncbi:MAG: thiol peroxidase [Flavobacteriales bacterium]|nr:thiol peroxidase [Flavobacteriales bacterium]